MLRGSMRMQMRVSSWQDSKRHEGALMKRSRIVSVTACLLATAALAAVSHLPKANTRAEVKRYVEDAAKVVKANGASCKTFESPEWRNGEYYIFVSGPDGKLLCHPRSEERRVGKECR